MRALLGIGVHPLYHLSEEGGHQVNVLQHDPATIFVAYIEKCVCYYVLTLTESNL